MLYDEKPTAVKRNNQAGAELCQAQPGYCPALPQLENYTLPDGRMAAGRSDSDINATCKSVNKRRNSEGKVKESLKLKRIKNLKMIFDKKEREEDEENKENGKNKNLYDEIVPESVSIDDVIGMHDMKYMQVHSELARRTRWTGGWMLQLLSPSLSLPCCVFVAKIATSSHGKLPEYPRCRSLVCSARGVAVPHLIVLLPGRIRGVLQGDDRPHSQGVQHGEQG